VALPGIPLWNDQDILLCHGTLDVHVSSILQAVDVTRGKPLKDFGRGFYTTTSKLKAEQWAQDLSLNGTGKAAVIEFRVCRDDLAQLDFLFFIRFDSNAVDFWSFVQHCRTNIGDHGRAHTSWYDMVVGPVTGTWKRLTTIPSADQISFHTFAGATVLDRSGKVQVL
jgi:hypothetical protein